MSRNNSHAFGSFRERAILLAALLIALASAVSMHAQASAPAQTAKTEPALRPRDLTGLWFGGVGGGLRVKGTVSPLTPEGQTRFSANTAELKSDRTISA